jgi:hypothetical protein
MMCVTVMGLVLDKFLCRIKIWRRDSYKRPVEHERSSVPTSSELYESASNWGQSQAAARTSNGALLAGDDLTQTPDVRTYESQIIAICNDCKWLNCCCAKTPSREPDRTARSEKGPKTVHASEPHRKPKQSLQRASLGVVLSCPSIITNVMYTTARYRILTHPLPPGVQRLPLGPSEWTRGGQAQRGRRSAG